ncbi:MAG: hypothetical protein U5K54_11715 [Cytophagales bacterium]|nr:hypothetical protein [Cytophagales bacterium]
MTRCSIEILFLGHVSKHHNSAQYLPMLAVALGKEGINFTYTDDPADLNPEKLAWYDGVMIYANHDSITQPQEAALLNFVESGKRIYSHSLRELVLSQFRKIC